MKIVTNFYSMLLVISFGTFLVKANSPITSTANTINLNGNTLTSLQFFSGGTSVVVGSMNLNFIFLHNVKNRTFYFMPSRFTSIACQILAKDTAAMVFGSIEGGACYYKATANIGIEVNGMITNVTLPTTDLNEPVYFTIYK